MECQTCGESISDEARFCPTCGSPNSATFDIQSLGVGRFQYLYRTRMQHLAIVPAMAAYGLFALMKVDFITSAGKLLGLAISVYFLVFMLARAYLLRDVPVFERKRACFDILEIGLLSFAISFIGGFWWGFAAEVLDGGFQVKQMFQMWGMLFGVVSGTGILLALTVSAVTYATSSEVTSQQPSEVAPTSLSTHTEARTIEPAPPPELTSPLDALRQAHRDFRAGSLSKDNFRSQKQLILSEFDWDRLGGSPEDILLQVMRLRDEGVLEANDVEYAKRVIIG